MIKQDFLRPSDEPAKTLYDALQIELARHPGQDWIRRVRETIWQVARDYSQQQGIPVLTLASIERLEALAAGHSDYGAKFAIGVAGELLERKEEREESAG